jgi:GMP synthase-like glutamine amidotransferase
VRGVVLQNEADDPPAVLGKWLRDRKVESELVEVWNAGLPSDPLGFDWIVALGAANSVSDHEPGWIPAQVEFLRAAIAGDVPVLGICFGGQALSVALGGELSAADPPAIGWLEARTEDPNLVPAGPWAHFNYECFSVPDGATLVASSPAGPGAFVLGPHLGLQFHPEATPSIVDGWASSEAERLARHGISPEQVHEQGQAHGEAAARQAFALFDAWWGRAGLSFDS